VLRYHGHVCHECPSTAYTSGAHPKVGDAEISATIWRIASRTILSGSRDTVGVHAERPSRVIVPGILARDAQFCERYRELPPEAMIIFSTNASLSAPNQESHRGSRAGEVMPVGVIACE
jgi:hypothetical protein